MVWTVNFTSTLSPTIINEARFGYRVTGTNQLSPFDGKQAEEARAYALVVNSIRMAPQLGAGGVNFQIQQPIGTGLGFWPNTSIDSTPLWTYADTVSWTKGTHSYKGGAEIRLSKSKSNADGFFGGPVLFSTYVRALGGELTTSQITALNSTNMPGLAGTTTMGNRSRMEDLLTFLAGSIGSVNQRYFINFPQTDHWEDFRDSPYITRDFRQKEFSLFFKDDWKVHKNLTLNLGVRYEYYGVPHVASGLTIAPVDGGAGLFGISGRGFESWMKPGPVNYDPNLLTKLEFVGPNSPNPDKLLWPKDWNNIAPAVGFSWQIPWFGEGKTTLRGGYQITHQGGGRFYDLDTQGIGSPPGSNYEARYAGFNPNTGVQDPYVDLTDISSLPVPAIVGKPLADIPVTDRTATLVAFDPTYVAPYTQNLTLQLTRSVRRNLTVDLRYVGTMQVKGYRDLPLNNPNFLYNGLKEAFDAVRAGRESELLDRMFAGINIAGTGFGPVLGPPVNGVAQTAGLHMRASNTFNSNLANGNYQALATSINTLVINTVNNPSIPAAVAGLNGAVLRYSGQFPENFIATNPQLASATLKTNLGHTNYHSMQAQVTLRPTYGFSLQGTYAWSRSLGTGQAGTGFQGVSGSAPAFTNPVDRRPDYTLQSTHRLHDFRTNGTIELPIGPNKLLLPNSSGLLARLIERWQMGFILNSPAALPSASLLKTCCMRRV